MPTVVPLAFPVGTIGREQDLVLFIKCLSVSFIMQELQRAWQANTCEPAMVRTPEEQRPEVRSPVCTRAGQSSQVRQKLMGSLSLHPL